MRVMRVGINFLSLGCSHRARALWSSCPSTSAVASTLERAEYGLRVVDVKEWTKGKEETQVAPSRSPSLMMDPASHQAFVGPHVSLRVRCHSAPWAPT